MDSPQIPPQCVDVSRGTNVVVVETVCATIIIILALMRTYVRAVLVKSPGWDDVFIAAAIILFLAVYGMDLQEVNWGAGRHIECLPFENAVKAGRYQYISEVPLITSLLFSRFSFCIFLLRLFSIQKFARIIIYVLMVIIFAVSASSDAIIIPQCTPRAKLWDPMVPGTCWSPNTQLAVGYFNGAVSAACDLALALLPIYFLRTIQMPLKTKVTVCILMSIAAFTAVCAIIRTALLSGIKGSDVTYDIVNVTIFAVLEGAIAIIAATVPTLKPLFSRGPMLDSEKGSDDTIKQPLANHRTTYNSDTQDFGWKLTKGSGASQSATVTSRSGGRNDSGSNVDNIGMIRLQENEVLRQVDIEVTRQ